MSDSIRDVETAVRELGALPVPVGTAPKLTAYRAGFQGHDIPLGFYDNPAAARQHCEAFMRREAPTASFDWIEDEEDGVAELVATIDGDEIETGYLVTALEIASSYDEEADE